MTLADRIQGRETVAELARASDRRFVDAIKLEQSQRFTGSIYMAGISAEACLKVAFYRLRHRMRGDWDAEELQQFAVVRSMAQKTISHGYGLNSAGYRNGHGLQWWCDLIFAERQSSGLAMMIAHRSLLRKIELIEENWRVDLRYSGLPSGPTECRSVLAATHFLRKRETDLWR